jgi:rare lipoprotein A
MKTTVFIVLASLSFLTTSAEAKWECHGPEYVCSQKTGTLTKTAQVKQSTKASKNIITDIVDGISGLASYYWQPQALASGGRFNPNALTAAHKTLPFGTKVRVTNKHNGKSVVVTINDRGPYIRGRIIDLSRAAAAEIGMLNAGVAPIKMAKLN